MRQVRLALGPDALIVSNRRVNGGVEILATDPTSLSEVESGAQARPLRGAPGGQQGAPQPSQSVAPAAPATPAVPTSPASQHAPSNQRSTMSPLGAYAAAFQAVYGDTPAPAQGAQPNPATQAQARPEAQTRPQAQAPQHLPALPQQASQPGAAPYSASPYAPPASPGGLAALQGAAPSASASTDPLAQPGIMDAIGAMRGALETRIDELLWGNQLRRAPQAASLFQTLLGFGFSTALLRAMLKRLPEQLAGRSALQWVRQEMDSHLPVLENEDTLWQPGLALALVGPTGVGKTTTIAKLAARCVRRFGPDKLVLITTDTYRIGAHEQLKIYGQMLRVPVHVVRNANELRDVMQGIRPDQLILIDNVGISQRDRYISEQAA